MIFDSRRILHYTCSLIPITAPHFEILDQIHQTQQVFEFHQRSPPGENHKRVGLTDIGPTRWEKGRLPILGIIKYPPLTPAPTTINKVELPSTPGGKWVGYPKMLFWILCLRCSSGPTPTLKLKPSS